MNDKRTLNVKTIGYVGGLTDADKLHYYPQVVERMKELETENADLRQAIADAGGVVMKKSTYDFLMAQPEGSAPKSPRVQALEKGAALGILTDTEKDELRQSLGLKHAGCRACILAGAIYLKQDIESGRMPAPVHTCK